MTMPAPPPVPPPFDPELVAVLADVGGTVPTSVTPDMIPGLREIRNRMAPSHEELRGGGAFEVEEVSVRSRTGGRSGGPPAGVPSRRSRDDAVAADLPHARRRHDHRRTASPGRADVLDWAVELGAVVVSVEYRLAPEHPTRPGRGLLCRARWWPRTPPSSASTPTGSSSPGRARAAASPPGSPCWPATGAARRSLGQLLMCPMLDDRNDHPVEHPVARPSASGTSATTTPAGTRCSATDAAARTSPSTPPRRGRRPVRTAARLHRRRIGRDLPRRGRRLRHPALAGRRPGRAARVARRVPRIRPRRPAGEDLPGRQGGPGALAAQAVGELTSSLGLDLPTVLDEGRRLPRRPN